MATISQDILFTIPIPPHKSSAAPSPGGTITVSRITVPPSVPADPTASEFLTSHPKSGKPRPQHGTTPPSPPTYLLTHHSPPDNRLTPPFCQAYLHALLKLQHTPEYPPGLLLTTSSIPKFYSNGLDLATFTPADKHRYLYPLWRKLLTYPMPTCAILNGHTFAGGLMLAMCHDYRLANPHRGWLCLNELEFDAELAPGMVSIFKVKVSNAVYRTLVLEAKRFTGLQALEVGLVDGLGGLEEALAMMGDVEGGHGRGPMVVGVRGRGTAYGKLKEEVYRGVLAEFDIGEQGEERYLDGRGKEREGREREEKILLQGLGVLGKAKL